MLRRWVTIALALFVAACSGGKGDPMVDDQAQTFVQPEMQRAAALLLAGQYAAAIEAARRSDGLDATNREDRTLLLIAIARNDRAGVHALLAAGANPNVPGKKAPVAAAAERADPAIVADLLQAGADPNGKVGSETAIWRAAVRNNFPIVEMLLKRGAAVDSPNVAGETPAIAATQAAKFQMAVFLLQHGASPFAKSHDGGTIAEWAGVVKMHPDTDEGRAREQLYSMLRQAGALQ